MHDTLNLPLHLVQAHFAPGEVALDFDRTLEESMGRAYIAARRILRDADLAHDATQEAAIRALRNRASYDPARPFYPWFYRILKNHCLDILARHRRSAPESLQSATPSSPEDLLMSAEQRQSLEAAIESLDPSLKELIELRHFQDLSYQEIAEVLDCPIGTVMSRLYRARKELRAAFLAAPRRAPLPSERRRS